MQHLIRVIVLMPALKFHLSHLELNCSENVPTSIEIGLFYKSDEFVILQDVIYKIKQHNLKINHIVIQIGHNYSQNTKYVSS